MKKNKFLYVLVGLFCLSISTASVYAASYDAQNHVGVRFVESTGSTNSTSSSSSSTSSTSSSSTSSSSTSNSSSYSSTDSSSSSLPDTESDQKKGGFTIWGGNDNGSPGGTTRYYSDDKLLPKTGELLSIALPFAGIFLVMIVFFYLKQDRRKTHE